MNPYQMKKEDVLKMLGTDENGLTQNQAKENQKKYGKNELAEGKKKNPFILFLEQYKDFLVIILIYTASFTVSNGLILHNVSISFAISA